MNDRAPAWPAMPEEVCFQRDIFREAGLLTQTHCVVTWIIADARGAPMFSDKRGTFICRSDDGKLPIDPVDYGRWAPIKTAPKDETTVLLHVPTRWAKWNVALPLAGRWDTGGFWVIFNADEAIQRVDPTHWMPVPERPAQVPS